MSTTRATNSTIMNSFTSNNPGSYGSGVGAAVIITAEQYNYMYRQTDRSFNKRIGLTDLIIPTRQQQQLKTTQLQENYTITEIKHEIMIMQCNVTNLMDYRNSNKLSGIKDFLCNSCVGLHRQLNGVSFRSKVIFVCRLRQI